jgi:hypothetical protein
MVFQVGSNNFVSKADDFEKVERVVSKLKVKNEINKSHSYASTNGNPTEFGLLRHKLRLSGL